MEGIIEYDEPNGLSKIRGAIRRKWKRHREAKERRQAIEDRYRKKIEPIYIKKKLEKKIAKKYGFEKKFHKGKERIVPIDRKTSFGNPDLFKRLDAAWGYDTKKKKQGVIF